MKQELTTVLPISIVIPAYSEEKTLPKLLNSIKSQIFQPTEIIVADAKSPDKTREIAKEFGCKIVEGGKVAVGRNAGAHVARSPYLLFLDADTALPNPYVLGDSFIQFIKNDVDIASARFIVDDEEESQFGKSAGAVLWAISNGIRAVQSLVSYPKWEAGAFIMVKKSVFEHVGGFNEKLTIGEDTPFFKQATHLGYKYKSLPINISTSVRRYDNPEKLAKMLGYVLLETAILSLGAYAGANLIKKIWGLYGNLGGGEGKDPNEE